MELWTFYFCFWGILSFDTRDSWPWQMLLRPTLHGDPGSKFLEPNWILELDLALGPRLHLGFSNHELSFELLFCQNQSIFPPKRCHVGLASICHLLVLDPHLKAMVPIYDSQPIALLYFIGPSSKVALSFVTNFWGSSIPKRDWINILRFFSPETNLGGWNAK